MVSTWQDAFTKVPGLTWKNSYEISHPSSISTLENLKTFLEYIHVKFCLLRPYFEQDNYPLVHSAELLPSFEPNLYEYVNLPGFSLVAFDRPLESFHEIFQFDLLHCVEDAIRISRGPASPFEPAIIQHNHSIFLSRLAKQLQEDFKVQYQNQRITDLIAYPGLLQYMLNMDRGHVLAKNSFGDFFLSGIYASFPSELDSELKRFGLRIGKFKPGDNDLYELNRNFVYQFLMELYGFPIVSERRTSAALFARRLVKMGEDFLIRVLGQSDRTLTTYTSPAEGERYPNVEKTALVAVDKSQKEQLLHLKKKGFVLGEEQPAVIVRVRYRQHKYDPNNVRTDRALSVSSQEIIHPLTGEILRSVNIIKDTSLMTLTLNDIVKGEYYGRIKYKRNEIVENTDTHEKRLKFLYAWLRKHQRRIISYSDEFYNNVVKVLDNYLLHANHFDDFQSLQGLYQEVWEQYSYIQQARKVKQLEDLKDRRFKGQKINVLEMLTLAITIMQDLKFELVHYFDSLARQTAILCDFILNDRYLVATYIDPPKDSLTEYGLQVRKRYGQLVKLADDFNSIRKSRICSPEEHNTAAAVNP
jgi:hypothetical protein